MRRYITKNLIIFLLVLGLFPINVNVVWADTKTITTYIFEIDGYGAKELKSARSLFKKELEELTADNITTPWGRNIYPKYKEVIDAVYRSRIGRYRAWLDELKKKEIYKKDAQIVEVALKRCSKFQLRETLAAGILQEPALRHIERTSTLDFYESLYGFGSKEHFNKMDELIHHPSKKFPFEDSLKETDREINKLNSEFQILTGQKLPEARTEIIEMKITIQEK